MLFRSQSFVFRFLYKVYEYIKSRLIEANIKKDVAIIDEVLPLIENVRDTWYEVSKKSKGL